MHGFASVKLDKALLDQIDASLGSLRGKTVDEGDAKSKTEEVVTKST